LERKVGDVSIDDYNKSEDEKDLVENGLGVKVKKLKKSGSKKGSMGLIGESNRSHSLAR
jgi:hypothetical protein